MEERELPRPLEERGLLSILSETFDTYGQHLWKFIGIAAIAQGVAVAAAVALPGQSLFDADALATADAAAESAAQRSPLDTAMFMLSFAIGIIASGFAWGASIAVVGQRLVNGRVTIGSAYTRMLWRGVSVATLFLILAALVALAFQLTEYQGLALLPFQIAALLALLAYIFYLTLAAPSVIIEGRRAMSSIRRAIWLARGSTFRMIWRLLVAALVTLGLLVAVTMPFGIAAAFVSGGNNEEFSTTGVIIVLIGSAVGSVVASQVMYIFTALLYVDQRVRKEGLEIAHLEAEMLGAARTADEEPKH